MANESNEYKQWLAGAPTDVALIEAIEINHASLAQPHFLVNWERQLTLNLSDLQTPRYEVHDPVSFLLQPASVSDSTDQETQLVISAAGGEIYAMLRALTPEQARDPITLTSRLYLSNDLDNVLISPAPVWNVKSTTPSRDTITFTLGAMPLRTRRIGAYFTAREFPVLVY